MRFFFQHKDDPMFVEFMEAHAKDSKNVWGNDTLANIQKPDEEDDSGVEDSKSIVEEEERQEEDQRKSIAHAEISDMEVCIFLKLHLTDDCVVHI